MTETTAAGPVPPNPQGPKTIGLLNIIFGAGLMLCSLCMGFSAALTPAFTEAMQIPQQQMVQQAEQRRAADAEGLRRPGEGGGHRGGEGGVPRPAPPGPGPAQAGPAPGMDMAKMGFGRPEVVATMWIDVLTSLVLNSLMIVAGVGLIRFREWGRRLALWVAGLKIARLVIVNGVYVLVAVPIFSKGIADMMADAMAQQQAMMGAARPPAGRTSRTWRGCTGSSTP